MGCQKITYKPKLEVIKNEKLEIRNHPKFLISHSQFLIEEVHMNGRIYDPVLRSFMSPDPFIQAPDNSQNYNRYAYCLNNPLLYTDPSGNLAFLGLAGVYAAAAIGALIGGVTYTAMAFYQGEFSWGGLAKSIIIGGISGAATFGIGTAALKIGTDATLLTTQIARAGFQAAAHGVFQGFISTISGGNFEQGFVSGALSSIASSAFAGFGGKFAESGAGTMLFGTVAGGVGASLTGGDFFLGAAQGLVVSSLNHVMHKDPIFRMLKKAGYTKEQITAIANLSNEELLNLAKRVFPKMYSSKKPNIEIADKQNTKNVEGSNLVLDGTNAAMTTPGGKLILVSPKSNTTESLGQLAVYLGHELYHSANSISAFANGNSIGYNHAYNEYHAYKYSKYLQGSDGYAWDKEINKWYKMMKKYGK